MPLIYVSHTHPPQKKHPKIFHIFPNIYISAWSFHPRWEKYLGNVLESIKGILKNKRAIIQI